MDRTESGPTALLLPVRNFLMSHHDHRAPGSTNRHPRSRVMPPTLKHSVPVVPVEVVELNLGVSLHKKVRAIMCSSCLDSHLNPTRWLTGTVRTQRCSAPLPVQKLRRETRV